MNKKDIELIFDSQLASCGFMKKNSSWYLESKDVVQLIDLQKSSYGMQFYVNICCVPLDMEVKGMPRPKERDFPIRFRLTSVFQDEKEQINSVLDLENGRFEDRDRANRIVYIVNDLILRCVDRTSSVKSIVDSIHGGFIKTSWLNVSVKKYLNIWPMAVDSEVNTQANQ